jgi:hypothetical protein
MNILIAVPNTSYIGATNFDGGPLANVAYDPRVGRTLEMYGECPYHAGQVGMLSTLALQNKTVPDANGDYFLQTSQVTRHFITDHGSGPDNGAGDYWGSLASLEDEFLPPFKAFQVISTPPPPHTHTPPHPHLTTRLLILYAMLNTCNQRPSFQHPEESSRSFKVGSFYYSLFLLGVSFFFFHFVFFAG